MKIRPNRTMFLDGRRVEFGKSEEVSQAAGDLAIRHGWAVEVPETKKPKADKDAE